VKKRFTKVAFFSIGLFSIAMIFSTLNLYSQEKKIRIIKEDAVVKLKPNNESIVIKKLRLGSVLSVEETIGEWVKIKLPPDKDGIVVTGYIHSSLVEFEIAPSQIKPKIKQIITEKKKELKLPVEETKEEKVPPKPREIETPTNVNFSVAGGLSNLIGDNGEYWKLGFYLGGSIFFPVSSSISVGGHVAYHRWAPDEEKLTEPYSGLGIDINVSGSGAFIEIIPAVRFALANTEQSEFFIQAGGGLCLMKLDVKVKASWLWIYEEASISESDNRPCLLFGGGAILGKKGRMRFEILALYHIVFTEGGERTEYFSAGLGLGF